MTDLLAHLRALEDALQSPSVRASRADLERLLLPDFEEVGRSGRRYTRAEVLERLPAEGAQVSPSTGL